MAQMAEALSSSTLHREQGSNIESLHQQAIRLSAFQPPSSRIVGLVGDSGVGKSSLINSLLDKEDFARASNSGAACTCVVTEYHFHERDDFIIQVDYFTLEALRRQFKELLRAYREYQSLPNDSDITNEERADLKKRADLAKNTFSASFKERLVQNPGILLSLPFDQAVNIMIVWALQILPQQETTRESFGLIRQCSARLTQLTSETDSVAQTCVWPFIRKIRVYLKAHVLSKGLIIADLPGLRDLNSARQSITERYVRQCHQIFAVAMIGRATTDQGVREVFELARHAKLSNDIKPNEARADWSAERARIDAMQENIDNATQRKESLLAEIEEFDSEFIDLDEEEQREQERELLNLQKELRRAEKSRDDLNFELMRHIVTIRNRKVSETLQVSYGSHSSGADLNIFCISNTMYWSKRRRPVQVSLPVLQLSGILELRRYCIGIVAESHLRTTTEYIRNEIPAFLGSVELWVQAGSGDSNAERKQQVLEAMSAIQRQLEELTSPVSRIGDISHSINYNFNDKVRVYMRRQAAQWSTGAKQASIMWHSWHHMSYAAWCRNHGDYYTPTMKSRCWNEEAIATMNDDLSDLWDAFSGDVESYLDRTNDFIKAVFDSVVRIMIETANAETGVRTALLTLTETFRHRTRLILYEVENIIEEFQAEMMSVRTDGLSPVRTSIVGQLMEDTYQTASRECGGGSDRRRKTIITDGFSSPTLFQDHRRRFKEQFVRISYELEVKMKDAITQQLAFIDADLNTLRDEKVVLESERNPEFRVRLTVELEEVKEAMRGIHRAIDDVTNASRNTMPMLIE
ncbi:hypothetical protein K505DRAFT_365563 [Melanomma pulvis-pyrius CBS 109.77]|uniref:P-loop containing nucleoside triphosphate hydrolase protein n=1 Tax=Melanomma pulvis-pyrius CBS 109.77 TaxID=1314802 RepID=A0A6A6WZZ5_9PLEO|nr:hypothetical protein K505DRAFT_365563 [Melanomma pulvis-pyrius CBS 109.77]